MVSGHARIMQQTDPRKVRVEYGKPLWSEVFDNNPRIAKLGEQGDFQIYHARVNGLRPYMAAKTADRWSWCDYEPPVGELYLHHHEKAFGNLHKHVDIVIEPMIKAKASPNKQWGVERWVELVRLLTRAGRESYQLGPMGTKVILGARLIETPTFRSACAVLSHAKAAVLPEGGTHHAAAALGVKAVVIYGGYISQKQTGYESQVSLFTGGTPCGMRTPCKHCADAMAKITPEMVMEKLTGLLA